MTSNDQYKRASTILVTTLLLLIDIQYVCSALGKTDCGPLYDPQKDLVKPRGKLITWRQDINLGFVSYPNKSTTLGSIAVFHCEKGHYVYGSKYAVCRTDGKWAINDELKCQRMECIQRPDNINITHGKIYTFSGPPYTIGEIYWVTCERGYKPKGRPIRQCLETDNDIKYKGIWSQQDKSKKILQDGDITPECIRDENVVDCKVKTSADKNNSYDSKNSVQSLTENLCVSSETPFSHPADVVVLASYVIGMVGTILLILKLEMDCNCVKAVQYVVLAILHCFLPFLLLIREFRLQFLPVHQSDIDAKIRNVENTFRIGIDDKICAKNKAIRIKEEEIVAKNSQLVDKDKEIQAKNKETIKKNNEIEAKNIDIDEKEKAIKMRNTDIAEKDKVIKAKDAEISEKGNVIKAQNTAISEKDREIEAQNTAISEKDKEIEAKYNDIADKDKEIDTKKRELVEMLTKHKLDKREKLVGIISAVKDTIEKIKNLCDFVRGDYLKFVYEISGALERSPIGRQEITDALLQAQIYHLLADIEFIEQQLRKVIPLATELVSTNQKYDGKKLIQLIAYIASIVCLIENCDMDDVRDNEPVKVSDLFPTETSSEYKYPDEISEDAKKSDSQESKAISPHNVDDDK